MRHQYDLRSAGFVQYGAIFSSYDFEKPSVGSSSISAPDSMPESALTILVKVKRYASAMLVFSPPERLSTLVEFPC